MSLDDPEFRAEICNELNVLIESDRAGVETLRAWRDEAPAELAPVLEAIALDQARCAEELAEHVRRLGAEPSTEVGAFFDKAVGIDGWPQRLAFLNRGQAWIVRVLDDLLPDVTDDVALAAFLGDMRGRHEAAADAVARAMR